MTAAALYAGKRVSVLGATGFIGSALVRALVAADADVTAFARGSASPSLPQLSGARIVLGDIRSPNEVRAALADAQYVFMMAGRSGAVESVNEAREDLDVNCGGLLNVLQILREAGGTPHIIFPGSRLEYGRPQRLPVHEDDPLLPLVPYGMHKAFCGRYLDLFARRHGFQTSIVRLTNPYGPAPTTFFRGYNVLNAMIAKALAGEAITIYGDGSQMRDYLYIDDAVELLLLAGTFPPGTVVNGGAGKGQSILEVAQTIVRTAKRGSIAHVDWPSSAAAAETGDFVADISRARSLGWAPRILFDEGIARTVRALAEPGT